MPDWNQVGSQHSKMSIRPRCKPFELGFLMQRGCLSVCRFMIQALICTLVKLFEHQTCSDHEIEAYHEIEASSLVRIVYLAEHAHVWCPLPNHMGPQRRANNISAQTPKAGNRLSSGLPISSTLSVARSIVNDLRQPIRLSSTKTEAAAAA